MRCLFCEKEIVKGYDALCFNCYDDAVIDLKITIEDLRKEFRYNEVIVHKLLKSMIEDLRRNSSVTK